jgi:hypothetical protein
MKTLTLCLGLLLVCSRICAQSEEQLMPDDPLYSLTPLDETNFNEDASLAFILDNTKTKMGRDLYEEFYRQWIGIKLDSTSQQQFLASVKANEELIIELEEIPSPGLSNLISIKVGDLLVVQQFIQTRLEAMEAQAAEAVEQVFQYFISYQEIQEQMGTADQSGTGIY